METTRHRRRWYMLGAFVTLVAVLICLRMYLGVWALKHVNEALNDLESYKGSVESIDIELYKGAYSIHGLKLYKRDSGIPAPFVDVEKIDLAIQWEALLHGRIVSDIDLIKPIINFAVNKNAKQTGAEEDWTAAIKDLMPIDINRVTFHDGKLTYQDFSSNPKVNIYIHHMEGEVRNLRNVVDKSQPLPSTLRIKGDSIGGGRLECKGRLNILKEIPDMHLDMKLEKVSLPALNDFSNAYAALDFKKGNLDLYSELNIKNSHVSGYVKPIAKNISLIDLNKEANPIKVAWSAIASTVITIFTNQRTDQFATKATLEGDLSNIGTDPWSVVGGIISNAFVSAVRKGFDADGKSTLLPDAKSPDSH